MAVITWAAINIIEILHEQVYVIDCVDGPAHSREVCDSMAKIFLAQAY